MSRLNRVQAVILTVIIAFVSIAGVAAQKKFTIKQVLSLAYP